MNAFEKFVYALQATMERPTTFGWYHFLWLAITIIASTLIIVFRKKISEKGVRWTIFASGLILILLEVLKQLMSCMKVNGAGEVTWSYQWYLFPFQFCSTPMYLMFIAGLCRKCKFRDCLYSYLATFALFGGLVTMLYPEGVYVSSTFLNVHTMIWHSSMVVLAVLLFASGQVKLRHFTIVKALPVFAVMITIAMLMNYTWVWAGGLETGRTFNMFYISPYYKCSLPLLGDLIYPNVPYIVFLLIYIIGFILAAYVMLLIAMLFAYLYKIIKNKKSNTNTLNNPTKESSETKNLTLNNSKKDKNSTK